jgi:ATP-dependent RNA helicase DeaD
VAITILDPREVGVIRQVERQLTRRIDSLVVPTAAALQVKRLERTQEQLRDLIAAGELLEFQKTVAPLLADHSAQDVAAAALALLAERTRTPNDEADIPTIAPRRPEAPGRPAGNGRPMPGGAPARPGRPGFGAGPTQRQPRRGMARLFVSVGRMDGVGRRDLLDAIGSEVGLTPRDLGDIHTLERFSTVEVPQDVADQAIEALNGIRMRGRRVEVRHDGRR